MITTTRPMPAPQYHGLSESVSAIPLPYFFAVPVVVVPVVVPAVVVAPGAPGAAPGTFGVYWNPKSIVNPYTRGVGLTCVTAPTFGSSKYGSFLMFATKSAIAFGLSPRPTSEIVLPFI